MNANRKTDLRRKLALPRVPAPPAGLVERIKRDIPSQIRLDAEGERKRIAESFRLTLRVAASILVLTIGTYAMLHVLSRVDEDKPMAVSPERKPAAANKAVAPPPPAAEAAESTPSAPPSPATHVASKVARRKIEPQATRETLQPAPVSSAAPAVAGSVGTETLMPAAPAADTAKTQALMVQQARLDAEATVSPVSGRTMLRVVVTNAPDANVEIEGARQLSSDVYAIEGERATIRLRYRQDGTGKTLERTISRDDIRPWNEASPEMRDAVMKAENPQR